MIPALVIFAVTYLLMLALPKERPWVALCSAAVTVVTGVLCELTNDDGSMARLPQVAAFARAHGMPLCSVEDIVAWRSAGRDHRAVAV